MREEIETKYDKLGDIKQNAATEQHQLKSDKRELMEYRDELKDEVSTPIFSLTLIAEEHEEESQPREDQAPAQRQIR